MLTYKNQINVVRVICTIAGPAEFKCKSTFKGINFQIMQYLFVDQAITNDDKTSSPPADEYFVEY